MSRYKNLQKKENLVRLEDWKEIWIPDFVMKNTEDTAHTTTNPDEHHSIVKLSMVNESKFTSAYSEEYLNDFYYEGSNVLISKTNTYSYPFICDYDWRDYPFDTQVLTFSYILLNVFLSKLDIFYINSFLNRLARWKSSLHLQGLIRLK